jgi:L-lysine exporter family protein LysE/ArgO
MLTAAAMGFVIGFSLILAIGPQNAFVLRQGLMQRHVFWVCLVCAVSDAALITVGIGAAGTIGAVAPWATTAMTWGAIAFLIGYGALSLLRAIQPGTLRASVTGTKSLRVTLVTCLALAWLNPHVYLETVGLIGAVSTGVASMAGKIAFWGGAVLASFVFFFGLGYGARYLAPVFSRQRAWSAFDAGTAAVMWAIAANLALHS